MNTMSLSAAAAEDDWGDDDGIDDADGWDDDLDVSGGGMQVGSAPAPAPAASSLFAAPASEDDFFGGFDSKPTKTAAMRKMGTAKLAVPVKKTTAAKPAVKKLSNSDDVSDGWDDF